MFTKLFTRYTNNSSTFVWPNTSRNWPRIDISNSIFYRLTACPSISHPQKVKTFLKLNRGENGLINGTCRRGEFSRYAVNCWASVRACVRSALNSQWNYARVRVRTHLKLSAVRHRPCLVDVDAVVVIVRLHLNFILCEFQHFQGLVSQICLCSLPRCPHPSSIFTFISTTIAILHFK